MIAWNPYAIRSLRHSDVFITASLYALLHPFFNIDLDEQLPIITHSNPKYSILSFKVPPSSLSRGNSPKSPPPSILHLKLENHHQSRFDRTYSKRPELMRVSLVYCRVARACQLFLPWRVGCPLRKVGASSKKLSICAQLGFFEHLCRIATPHCSRNGQVPLWDDATRTTPGKFLYNHFAICRTG